MKKAITYFIILLSCSNIYAQLPDSLANYYQLVNKAELNILDSNYNKAFQQYEEAFNYHKTPFGKDIYNEAICCVLLNNYEKSYSNFKHLIAYGYDIRMLKKEKVLVDFFSSDFGMKLIKYSKQNVKSYNVDLRETYDSLFIADQYFRLKEGTQDLFKDTIKSIDNSNVDILQELIKTNGFPSQNIVGSYNSFDYFSLRLMVIHNSVGSRYAKQYFDFTDILYEAVHKGTLDARVALYLFARSRKDAYGSTDSGIYRVGIKIDNKDASDKGKKISPWAYFKLNQEKEDQLNKKRAKIGIDSIENDRRKIIYNLKDSRFHLTNPSGKQTILFQKEKEYKKMLNKLTFI